MKIKVTACGPWWRKKTKCIKSCVSSFANNSSPRNLFRLMTSIDSVHTDRQWRAKTGRMAEPGKSMERKTNAVLREYQPLHTATQLHAYELQHNTSLFASIRLCPKRPSCSNVRPLPCTCSTQTATLLFRVTDKQQVPPSVFFFSSPPATSTKYSLTHC